MDENTDAKTFMAGLLKYGPLDCRRVKNTMTAAGVSKADYRAAKKSLGVVSFSACINGESFVLWALPDKLDAWPEKEG